MKNKILTGATVLFAILFLFSAYMVGKQLMEQKKNADAFADIADLVQVEPKDSVSDIEDDFAEENIAPVQPFLSASEKYADVYEQNSDLVGWISIEGTRINYPVMQTPDDPEFYLKRGFDKSYSAYGVPFLQANCDPEYSDNLIIYGHHMKNGSMFADLCQYEDEGFFKDHKIICFDTLENYGEYEIVAAFKTVADTNGGYPYYQFVDAENAMDFEAYIEACKKLALYDTGVTAVYGDRLITLSTCEYSRTNGRMVIVAKLMPSDGKMSADTGD